MLVCSPLARAWAVRGQGLRRCTLEDASLVAGLQVVAGTGLGCSWRFDTRQEIQALGASKPLSRGCGGGVAAPGLWTREIAADRRGGQAAMQYILAGRSAAMCSNVL